MSAMSRFVRAMDLGAFQYAFRSVRAGIGAGAGRTVSGIYPGVGRIAGTISGRGRNAAFGAAARRMGLWARGYTGREAGAIMGGMATARGGRLGLGAARVGGLGLAGMAVYRGSKKR